MRRRDRSVLYQVGEIYALTNRLAEAEEALRAYMEIRPSSSVCALLA